MFVKLVISEEYCILMRVLVWVCLTLLVGILLFDLAGQYLSAQRGQINLPAETVIGQAGGTAVQAGREQAQIRAIEKSTWPASFVHNLDILRQYSWLFALIVVSSVMAQEYLWRVPQMLLGGGVSRPAYLGSRCLALFLPVLFLVLAPILITGIVSAFFTQSLLGTFNLHSVNYAQLGLSILAAVCGLLPYACLALLFTVISRGYILPIGGGLAFVVIENMLFNQRLPAAHYLPFSLGTALSQIYQYIPSAPSVASGYEVDPFFKALGAPWAFAGLAMWSGIFLLLAAVIFLKQDLPE